MTQELHRTSIIKTFIKDENTELEPKLYLSSDAPEARFISGTPKSALHFGQLKLFLCEIAVLTRFLDPKNLGEYYIIYAGAAPYRHGKIIPELFPGIHILLIDPADFDPDIIKMSLDKEKYDIRIINSLFTDKILDTIMKEIPKEKIIFLSDIRLNPVEEDIEHDMRLQEKWVRAIKPLVACLKFRLPWDGKTEYKYLSGDIMLQAYAPVSSTETRLIVTDPDSETIWNPRKYEDQMFYYNFGTRMQHYKWQDQFNITKIKGIDHCGDCTLFIKIVYDYISKFKSSYSLSDLLSYSIKTCAAKGMNLFSLWLVDNSKSVARKLHEISEKIKIIISENEKEYDAPIAKEVRNFVKIFRYV